MRKSELETAIQITARLIVEGRDRAEMFATRYRTDAKRRGIGIDTRIQYAEGSAAAYAMAGSILAGAMRAPNVEYLAGEGWRDPGPLPPMLAHDDDGFPGTQFAPGDDIAAAIVVRERMAAHETGSDDD